MAFWFANTPNAAPPGLPCREEKTPMVSSGFPAGDGRSALDTADASFAALTAAPGGLAVDGTALHPAFPQRSVGLTELRILLAGPALPAPARHAAWAALSARQADPAWVVGAVGVAMPVLRHTAAHLTDPHLAEIADVEADVLTGFLAALRALPAATPRLGNRLLWAGFRTGLAAAYLHSPDLPAGTGVPVVAAVPPAPWAPGARPLLAQAVRVGVLDLHDADLIARSRLDRVPLAALSHPLLGPGEELALRRGRAELRLVQAILAGRLGPARGVRR
jgi:hypothetical protein